MQKMTSVVEASLILIPLGNTHEKQGEKKWGELTSASTSEILFKSWAHSFPSFKYTSIIYLCSEN